MILVSTIFFVVLLAYLGIAAVHLFGSRTHGRGFSMFVLLYPIFFIAFFLVTARFVMFVWLGLSLVNMAFQFIYMKRAGVQKGLSAVMVTSLFLWPIQFAAAVNSIQAESETTENKAINREKIGALPATIKGTVSFTHHHGTEEGHDSVWLEEFGDVDLMTDAKTFDRIGIAEGKDVTLIVDEQDAFGDPNEDKVLWIIDGQVGDYNQ